MTWKGGCEVAKWRGVSENYGFPRLVGEGGWGDSNKTHSNKQQRTSSNEHQGKRRGTGRTRTARSSSAEPRSKENKKRAEDISSWRLLVALGGHVGPLGADFGLPDCFGYF